MKKHILAYGLVLSSALTACSTASVRVMPGENINRTIARDHDRDGAEEAATEAALKYCKEKGMEAKFVTAETKYTGEMEESTRNMVRRGSQAAMMIGGIGMGATRHRGPGALLGSAGTVGYVVTSGKDYEVMTDFKCM